MIYCVIEEIVGYGSGGTNFIKPLCVVEHEEIAKDIVKRYNGLTYSVYDTKENEK